MCQFNSTVIVISAWNPTNRHCSSRTSPRPLSSACRRPSSSGNRERITVIDRSQTHTLHHLILSAALGEALFHDLKETFIFMFLTQFIVLPYPLYSPLLHHCHCRRSLPCAAATRPLASHRACGTSATCTIYRCSMALNTTSVHACTESVHSEEIEGERS